MFKRLALKLAGQPNTNPEEYFNRLLFEELTAKGIEASRDHFGGINDLSIPPGKFADAHIALARAKARAHSDDPDWAEANLKQYAKALEADAKEQKHSG